MSIRKLRLFIVAISLCMSLDFSTVAAQDDLAVFRWMPNGVYVHIRQFKPVAIYQNPLYEEFSRCNQLWKDIYKSIPLPDELVKKAKSATIAGCAERIHLEPVLPYNKESSERKEGEIRLGMTLSFKNNYYASAEQVVFYALRLEKAREAIKPFLADHSLLLKQQRIGKYPLYAVDARDREGLEAGAYCILVGNGLILAATNVNDLQRMHDAGKSEGGSYFDQEDFADYAEAAAFGGEWILWNSFRGLYRYARNLMEEKLFPQEELIGLDDRMRGNAIIDAAKAEIFSLNTCLKVTSVYVFTDYSTASDAADIMKTKNTYRTFSTSQLSWEEADFRLTGRVIAATWNLDRIESAQPGK